MRMSGTAKRGLVAAWLLLTGAALATGCDSTVDGRPIAVPGAGPAEPSFPTSKPRVSPPTPQPTTPSGPTGPPTSTAPAGAIPLPPDDDGYVFIETRSGMTRCQISAGSVGCEAQFTNSPMEDGQHANGVNVTAGGDVEWVLGNLGDIPVVTIDYRNYAAQGWTIAATVGGTRFTNDRTGHGMFVSIENVEVF